MSRRAMPHTEAHIDYWVNDKKKMIWTRNEDQQPPNRHEIEAGEWTPYRKSDRNDEPSNGEWTQLKKGEIAKCVMWNPINIDNYRWYPQKYLDTYLERKTFKDDSDYEWVAGDPDTKFRMKAKHLEFYAPKYKSFFSRKPIFHEWILKDVALFPDRTAKFSNYTNMPKKTKKLTERNCFQVCVAYIIEHLVHNKLNHTIVDFESFKELNGVMHPKNSHIQMSTFHYMHTMYVAYELPLCIIRKVDLETAQRYVNVILEACKTLFGFNVLPQDMPPNGWRPTIYMKSDDAHVFYSSGGISDEMFETVKKQIAEKLSLFAGRTYAIKMESYLSYLNINKKLLCDICQFNNDGSRDVNQRLFTCINEAATLRHARDEELNGRIFKIQDWTAIGRALLQGACLATLVYRHNTVSLVTPHVKYDVYYNDSDHSIYTAPLQARATLNKKPNEPIGTRFEEGTRFIYQRLRDLYMDSSIVNFEVGKRLKVKVYSHPGDESTGRYHTESVFEIMMRQEEYVFGIPLCVMATHDKKHAETYAHIIRDACELFQDEHSLKHMGNPDWKAGVDLHMLVHHNKADVFYSSRKVNAIQLQRVQKQLTQMLINYIPSKRSLNTKNNELLNFLNVDDNVLRALCVYFPQPSVNGKKLFTYNPTLFDVDPIKAGEAFLDAARINTLIYIQGCVTSVLPNVKYGVRYDPQQQAVFAVYPRPQR